MPNITISLRIDEKLHDLLKASSKKCGRSVSETVRMACMAVLAPSEVLSEDQASLRDQPHPEDLLRRQAAARALIDEAYDRQGERGTGDVAVQIAEAERRDE